MLRQAHHPNQGPSSGFWGPVTASLDFCELNYNIAYYLAEFYNSISNIAMLAFGAYAYYHMRKYQLGKRFEVMGLTLAGVGIGSFLFHATLKFEAQMLDECPMLSLVLTMLYAIIENGKEKKYPLLPHLMVAFNIVFCTWYASDGSYAVFQATFASLAAIVILYAASFGMDRGAMTSNGLFLAAYLAWNVDKLFCPFVEHFQLHAAWHVLCAVSVYSKINFLAYHHQKDILGRKNVWLTFHCGIPTCTIEQRTKSARADSGVSCSSDNSLKAMGESGQGLTEAVLGDLVLKLPASDPPSGWTETYLFH